VPDRGIDLKMNGNHYPNMVQEYYVARVRGVMAARRERIAALKTPGDASRYVRQVRQAVRRCFPGLPDRTPLNPRVTGRETLPGIVLEKVLFESRPGFLVTGNLYIPDSLDAPAPGVLGLCGHASEGKACEAYQMFCQGLALRGFVVLIIDPIAQGERQQVRRRGRAADWNCCMEHNAMGIPMALTGDFFGSWRLWDAIRALDYLLSRPEVDPRRVGVTGNSGGGTVSAYLTALDSRLTMAAPSCFICSYLANLENELVSDAEQNPPGILAAGLDQVDLLLCHAPRPTLLLSQHFDFFDARAARQAGEDLEKVHHLLGSEATAEAFEGPHGHGFFQENREAMVRFFCRHAGLDGMAGEEGLRALPAGRLQVTPRGSILQAGNKPVYRWTAAKAAALAEKRGEPESARVAGMARKLLGIPPVRTLPHYRRLRVPAGGKENAIGARFAVESEPGIQVLLSVCGPVVSPECLPTGPVCLYVGHRGGMEDLEQVRRVQTLARRGGTTLLLVDPRGTGLSAPDTAGATDFLAPFGSDYLYACTGELLGESYLGRRVLDLLMAMDIVLANGATTVELEGRGLGSLVVAFAALLHKTRPRVRIFNYLPSYALLAQAECATWPLSAMLRGVLGYFDLPDVYKALGPRLGKAAPWGARMGA
jgi:dienelactone hydrolase